MKSNCIPQSMALHLPQSKLISSELQSGPIQYLDSAVAETCALEKTESEIRRPNKISPCGHPPSSAVRETPQKKKKQEDTLLTYS